MGLILAAFLGFFLSLPSYGETFSAIRPDGRAKLLVEDGSEGEYFLDEIISGTDGWPELLARHTFSSAEERDLFRSGNFPSALEGLSDSRPELKSGAGALWPVTASWNWEWERRFAQWVRAEFQEDFFQKYNIATDCADVAYALRWIFARANGLPMSSRLATGHWFTQNSLREEWKKLKPDPVWHKDKRFLKALDYLLNLTYTHTLNRDAYPVAVGPESILEGGFQLYIHDKSGHTQPIARIRSREEPGLPMEILQSTVPRSVRGLFKSGYWLSDQQKKGEGGLMRFRWPLAGGAALVAPEKMPFYSLEQYEKDFRKAEEPFFLAVIRRLRPDFDLGEMVESMVKDLIHSLENRKAVVEEGFAFCAQADCAPGTQNWENWSTPSRDKRIKEMMDQILNLKWNLPEKVTKMLEETLRKPLVELDGQRLPLETFIWAWLNGLPSADPRDEPSLRWSVSPSGLEKVLKKTAGELWKTRQSKIRERGVCDSRICQPGNPAWKEHSTEAVDQKLADLRGKMEGYCQAAPESYCATWKLLKETPYSLIKEGLTFARTFDHMIFLNSDPRVSAERRNGEAMGSFRFVIGAQSGSFLHSKGSALLQRAEDSYRLWNLADGNREIVAPGRIKGFDRDREVAWFVQGKECGTLDLQGVEGGRAALPFEPKDILVTKAGNALALTPETWAFLVRENGAVRLAATGRMKKGIGLGGDHLLVREENAVLLYDFTGAVPAAKELAIPTDQFEFDYGYQTDLGWFLVSYRRGNLQLLKKDGSLKSFPGLNFAGMVEDSGRRMLAMKGDEFQLLTLDDNGNVTGNDVIKGAVYWNGITLSEEKTGRNLFLEAGKIGELRLNPGEIFLGRNQEYLVSRKGAEFSLRRRSDQKTILSTKERVSLGQGKEMNPHWITFCRTDESRNPDEAETTHCRMEDLASPDNFSLFTGLKPTSFWEKGEHLHRGFVLQYSSQVWLERVQRL